MSENKTIKILFFGDIVGRPGRNTVRDYLSDLSNSGIEHPFVIANVENASHGFGLTEKNYNELSGYGIHCMTSGNHIWDKKEIFTYINNADKLIRPFNYPFGTTGAGSRIFDYNGFKIGVVNILGRVFMTPVDSPWTIAVEEIKKLKKITSVVIVDFHAEATAEKICFANYCSQLGVSAFFGTHTHVQTADEKIINGMSYITDAGFCGTYTSVIGMDYDTSFNRFTTCIPERYEVAEGDIAQINAAEVEITPSTGRAISIKRIFCLTDKKEKDNEE